MITFGWRLMRQACEWWSQSGHRGMASMTQCSKSPSLGLQESCCICLRLCSSIWKSRGEKHWKRLTLGLKLLTCPWLYARPSRAIGNDMLDRLGKGVDRSAWAWAWVWVWVWWPCECHSACRQMSMGIGAWGHIGRRGAL